ncbi:DUF308 domain-containing protein [Flavobacterium reichenbachii]|uniref:Uncharacterized protein n=1 Tax=Flavobacterium reichenbachii TaxID=362418 RepID=A0A085ZQN9_9FLAO|nr:DUF308 domain-containing protein [Flavobacterium reichenbachii]KFF06753.1 hypothetical protein IW19_15115 [Flavobacterium reichenbachii]OXB18644.1 hypothetical protein B0A68_01095 [Flavobacterium reichenbachii]
MDNINKIVINEDVIKLKPNFITFRKHLFTSLFLGEYYSAKFSEKIKSLLNQLDSIDDSVITQDPYIKKRYYLARDYLLHFQYLNLFITNRLKDNYSIKIYNFEYEDVFEKTSFFQEKNISIDDSLHWLFVANIKLSEMDEGYSVDEKTILILSEIYHKLERINPTLEFFVSKTRTKCSILLYKILKRLKKTNKLIEYSIFNQDNITIQKLEEYVPDTIIKNIDSQYNCLKKNDIHSLSKEIQKSLDNKTLNISSSHKYIKIIKLKDSFNDGEYKRTREILENINLYFSEKIKDDEINNISFKTCTYLVLNCQFTLDCNHYLKKIKSDFKFDKLLSFNSKIDESFNSINSLENTDYPNCILNKIYVRKKIELIDIIKNSNPKELNNEEHDYFSILENIFTNSFNELNNLKSKIKVCQKNKIMPLYIELENCKLDDKTFIDSQYILPSNYEYLLDECDNDWDKLKIQESIFYSFTPKVIKEINEKLKKDIKEQQYSIITVIGLYASFITFILANVNVLPELIKHSIGAVLAFMLVFGIVLFYFITSLKLLFTAKKIFKGISNFILWAIFGLILIILGFIAIFKFINIDFKKDIENKKTTTTITTFDLKTGKKQSETKTLEQNSVSEKKDSLQ